MKRFLFAVAVVALSASFGSAEDKPATPAAPTTPTVTAATPAIEYAPAQPQRRGLFGRLRNRNNTTTYSTPIMTTPAATPMPKPGTTPEPMPGTKPAGGTTTNGTTPTPAIVPAGGSLPPGTYKTTDGTIVQIGGTQPMATTQMSSERRGLFSRLRTR